VLAGEIYGPKQIRLVDVPEPELDPNGSGEIIFQPELTCLCGSDMLFFEQEHPEYKPRLGHSLHEMIGRVVATNGERYQVNDRVLCIPVDQNGLWERYVVDENRAIPVDPRPPEDHALMAQPLGTVILAMRRVPPVLGQRVAVIGQGPMGQLFCATLRNLGARQIIAIDKLGYRLETSLKMGATDVVNSSEADPVEAVKRLTDGEGADLVIEVVGHTEQVLNLCVDLGRVDSTILFFGVPMDVIEEIHWRKLFWNRQKVVTSVGPDFATDFPLAMQWIAEGRLDVSPLITHRYPLSDIQRAFDQYHARGDNGLKILLDFPSAQ